MENLELPLLVGMTVMDELTGEPAKVIRIIPMGQEQDTFGMWGGLEVKFEDETIEARYSWEVNQY